MSQSLPRSTNLGQHSLVAPEVPGIPSPRPDYSRACLLHLEDLLRADLEAGTPKARERVAAFRAVAESSLCEARGR